MALHVIYLLCEAKIYQLDMTLPVQENIFGLQVSVDDVPFVQLLYGYKDFGKIKDRILESQTHLLLNLLEQLAT